jgi:hypothetical protein
MIDCVHSPGPPLRFSPGWQNGQAFGPKAQSDASRIDASRNPVRLSPGQLIRQVLQRLVPTHPIFFPTSLPPAGTTVLFLLSDNVQKSCRIEGRFKILMYKRQIPACAGTTVPKKQILKIHDPDIFLFTCPANQVPAFRNVRAESFCAP